MEQRSSITTGNLAAREICARISFTGELFYEQKPKMIHLADPRRLFICRLQSPTSSLRLPTSTDVFFQSPQPNPEIPSCFQPPAEEQSSCLPLILLLTATFFPHPSFFSALKRWPATAILGSIASGVRVKHQANKHDLDKRN